MTVTDEELESLSPERSRTIEILEFIDLKEVDPLYYDRPYYLVPAKGGEKAYRLLVEVLRQTNKAGLAKFVLAEREHLVAVKSEDGALSLITLHYSGDILPAEEFAPKEEHDRVRGEAPGAEGDQEAHRRLQTRKVRRPAAQEDRRVPAQEGRSDGPGRGARGGGAGGAGEGPGPPDLVAALREAMQAMKKKR